MMRLHDVESAVLLPRFAHNAEWEQYALDDVVKSVRAKSYAMSAPFTRRAISALSDAELQEFYAQYSIAKYYPDLSRETRETMLFELARVYRTLGTPYSVELLCNYIFDGADRVGVEIADNLAFSESGQLVDASLLDLFDVNLTPSEPVLSDDKARRIVENIFRFCRNSQTLRNINMIFADTVETDVHSFDCYSLCIGYGFDDAPAVLPPVQMVYDFMLIDGSGRVVYGVDFPPLEFTPTGYFTIDEGNEVIFVEQSPFPVVCIDEGTRTPESIAPDNSFDTELPYYASKLYIVTTDDGQDETLYGWEAEEGTPVDNTIYMFGFWYDTNANDWTFEPRGGSDYQWMGITSQEDVTKLSDIGIGVSTTNAAYGPYGCPTDALVNGNYKFVVLGYYDDLAGTTPSQYSDVNNFYMRSMRRDWVYITEIFLTSSISVNVAFYKVRIEAITPELGYFNASGTAEALPSNTAIPLYRDGVQIPYESGRQYRARGLYDGDDNLITDNPVYFSFSKQNGSLYFSQSYTSGVTAKYIAFV